MAYLLKYALAALATIYYVNRRKVEARRAKVAKISARTLAHLGRRTKMPSANHPAAAAAAAAAEGGQGLDSLEGGDFDSGSVCPSATNKGLNDGPQVHHSLERGRYEYLCTVVVSVVTMLSVSLALSLCVCPSLSLLAQACWKFTLDVSASSRHGTNEKTRLAWPIKGYIKAYCA